MSGDVNCASQINLENLFDLGFAAVIATAFAVALVHQELVTVDGKDLAYAGAGGQEVGVLVGRAGANVDGDDAQQSWRRCLGGCPGSARLA